MFIYLEMKEMQAIMQDREEKVAELNALREKLDDESRKAQELQEELARSHELEQSEKDRLVIIFIFIWSFLT